MSAENSHRNPSATATAKPRHTHLSTLELAELDEACRIVNKAVDAPSGFGCYLVGSATERSDFRDVDVRLILPDENFDYLLGERKPQWAALCRIFAAFLRLKTGLRVDFQIQRATEANEKYVAGTRNPLGGRDLRDFAGGGDGTPAW